MVDLFTPAGPPADDEPNSPIWRKALWFAGISLASVAVVVAFAYFLRALLFIG